MRAYSILKYSVSSDQVSIVKLKVSCSHAYIHCIYPQHVYTHLDSHLQTILESTTVKLNKDIYTCM